MTIKENILIATDYGRLIIEACYPQSANCFGTKKKFSIREETEPSASVKLYTPTDGRLPEWIFSDFGDKIGLTPIEVYADYKNIDYNSAVAELAAKYHIETHEDMARIHQPHIESRPALKGQEEGLTGFEYKDRPTEAELKFFAPGLTTEQFKELGWKSVNRKWIIKNGKEISFYTTPTYFMFSRTCNIYGDNGEIVDSFEKIYTPKPENPNFKFSYYPAGKKPSHYINGLDMVRKAYEKSVAEQKEEYEKDKKNKMENFTPRKLYNVFITSGERDAASIYALGELSVWFNSETHKISDSEILQIRQYTYNIINIPDIDETGIKQGLKLANEFIFIKTLWLPESLRDKTGDQGKPCKDFRDWRSFNRKKDDFIKLVNMARPMQFWTEHKERNGKNVVDIHSDYLFYFLSMNGYYRWFDKILREYIFIHISGQVVEEVTRQQVRNFILEWKDLQAVRENIRSAINDSKMTEEKALGSIFVKDIDFRNHTPNSQILFFRNKAVEVSAEGVKEIKKGSHYAWKENLIDHTYTPLEPCFSWEKIKDTVTGEEMYALDIISTKSKFFQYMINSSRLSWRKEDEEKQELTDKEIRDNVLCLEAKMFYFANFLWRHKDPANPMAPLLLDYNTQEGDERNGGSGKSFLAITATKKFGVKTLRIPIKNSKSLDNDFIYDEVTPGTELIVFDECYKNFPYQNFFSEITDGISVNPKHNHRFTLSFHDSPKFAFISNFVPKDTTASGERRNPYVTFSDWYHQKTNDNNYAETRKISDDFNQRLFEEDYSDEDWNEDINFVLNCLQFMFTVLKETNSRIESPRDNIIARRNRDIVDDEFDEFARKYFEEDNHLNEMIDKRVILNAYNNKTPKPKEQMNPAQLKKAMKAWCEINDYTFCPEDKWTDHQNRRIKKNSIEYFYIEK